MKNKKPLVSIVMPARNAGDFLLEALQSIKNQTYKNWELIVVDDASVDNTLKILKKFAGKSKNIKIIQNKKNLGVSMTANIAISKAQGQFIARMDADDVAHPHRLQKQVDFLLKNPDVVAVGAQCKVVDEEGNTVGIKKFPQSFEKIKELMFYRIPVQQPTFMINKTLLPKNFVFYDKSFFAAEEVELLFKLFRFGKVVNLPDILLNYRIHQDNTSLKHPKRTFYLTFKSRFSAIFKYGYRPTLKGITYTMTQLVVVTLLPSRLIFPLYFYLQNRNDKRGGGSGARLSWQIKS